MKPKLYRTLAAAATASVLMLSACGGDDSGAGDSAGGDGGGSDVEQGDGVLTVGALLPQTGSLAFLGPPEFAGVELAVQEINEAGGVLGEDVAYEAGDEGDADNAAAPAEADRLLDADADVIVGTASSGVATTVINKIMSAGTVMFSPANTTTSFDEGDFGEPDNYFRTSPSDVLQGAVLANLLVQDGRRNVAILARQDAYGETLAKQVADNLESQGSQVAATVFYGENQQSYDSQVAEVAASNPDAVALIAFEETTRIIPQLIQENTGPQDVPTYFVDGNTADYSADSDPSLPPGTLAGVKGTIPGADTSDDFKDRLLSVNPKLTSWSYSAEAYDATIVAALAAVQGENDAGDAIALEIPEVTKNGTKCTSFQECADLLADGEDIDYDGQSGPIEHGETGSPSAASIGIYEYDRKNSISPVEFIEGQI